MKPRFLPLLLALCLALTVLCACGKAAPAEQTSDTTASTETTAPAAPANVDIVVDGKAQYAVIRDEDADASALPVVQAQNIMNQIKSLTNASVKLGTDWIKRGTELDSSTYEILIGLTDYPETKQVMGELNYGEWAIRVVGNKIVVFGYSNAAMSKAVSRFNSILSKNVSDGANGKTISIPVEALNITESGGDERLSALPKYETGSFLSYYKAGNEVDEIIVGSTTPEEYRAYLTVLEKAGFTCYTTNELNGNLFATYTNADYTVTAGYYDYETSARILIEPLAPAVGLKADNQYTPITTSQITMIGLEYKNSDGSYTSNGLSVLIRLTDGRFIIVDGGFNREKHASLLMSQMKEQSKEYAKSTKDITVAAWIVTHPHGDHEGTFKGKTGNFMGITIERVLVNFLSETENSKAYSSESVGKNWSSGDVTSYNATLAAAKQLGATVYQVHVGQVFYFADLKIDILYTIESFGPRVCNAVNTTSTVMRMEFGGPDGTVYMSTGDATGYGMEIATKMFGDYMQSDIVQVCHHGYTTWGNDNGMIKAYRAINAATVLWPQGTTAYPNYKTKAYNSVVFEVPNYKEVYVAGTEGNITTLPIPYTVGTAAVKAVS